MSSGGQFFMSPDNALATNQAPSVAMIELHHSHPTPKLAARELE